MKINEIDFDGYSGKRIAVVTKKSIMNFPADVPDAVKHACGELEIQSSTARSGAVFDSIYASELEIAENGINVDETGWVTIKTVYNEKNNS